MKFVFVIMVLMLLLDVAWLWVALRLATGKFWRGLVVVFVAAQIGGFVWMIGSRLFHAGFGGSLPRIVPVSVVTWHFFGLAALLIIGLLVLAAGGVRLAGRRLQLRPAPAPVSAPAESTVNRRQFLGRAAALAPPLFTLGLSGTALAQLEHFRVRSIELAIPGLPRDLHGLTIAHVSDMHVGWLTPERLLHRMIETVNGLKADLVLVTGDLINDALSDLPEGLSLVKALESRYGLWMIEGNHDLIENGPEFERRAKASGVPFLLDESAMTTIRGQPIQILGLRWHRVAADQRDLAIAESLKTVLRDRDPEAFPILLAHHPHAFDAAAVAGLPLTLSGHTHGGQLMLDERHGFGPAMFRYWSGLYQRPGSQLVVSNGVGNWFPLRINAPAELLHLTLRRT